jgi:hypothetical protein
LKTASPRSANKGAKEGPKKRGPKPSKYEAYVEKANAKIEKLREKLKNTMDKEQRQKIRN